MTVELELVKVEHGLMVWPDEPEPLVNYDSCQEAELARMLLGGGTVVSRATYRSEWVAHVPHA